MTLKIPVVHSYLGLPEKGECRCSCSRRRPKLVPFFLGMSSHDILCDLCTPHCLKKNSSRNLRLSLLSNDGNVYTWMVQPSGLSYNVCCGMHVQWFLSRKEYQCARGLT